MNATPPLALALLAAAVACADKTPDAATTDTTGADTAAVVAAALPDGEARLAVPGGNIWYKGSVNK